MFSSPSHIHYLIITAGGNTVELSYSSDQPFGSSSAFDKYYYQTGGDTALDWSGAEDGQRPYNGVEFSEGSPSVKTTNVVGETNYYYLNT